MLLAPERASMTLTHSKSDPFPLRTRFKTFTAVAEVLVGPSSTRFLIHRELLCHHSPFFAAALNGAFAEGLSQIVKLPEERLDSFEYFVSWLYTQDLGSTSLFKDGKPTYFVLLDLYSLADRLAVEALRNQTVDKLAALAEQTNSVLTPSDTHLLYDGIRDNSPLRRLVLDLFAFKKTDNLLANHPDDWHPSFLRDLVVKLKRPGVAGLAQRHDARPWKPASWATTKACDVCRQVLKPQFSANLCQGCGKAFCSNCVVRGQAVAAYDWPVDGGCKPWKRGMCVYHEHVETPVCGGVEGVREGGGS